MGSIYCSYNVSNYNANKNKINLNNSIIRELLKVYKKQLKIPYYAPLVDTQRKEFETRIINCGINDNDSLIIALQKFHSKPKKGYTSEDVQNLIKKIENK